MIKDIFYLIHNRLDLVRQAFPSLRHTVKHPYKLWVIDNGSTIENRGHLTRDADYHVKFSENVGIAAAINRMAQLSREKWFVYVESDCLVHKGWVEEIESVLGREIEETTNTFPDSKGLAWMGFKLLKPDGDMAFFYRNMDDHGESLKMPGPDPKDHENNMVRYVDAPCNVLSLFNRDALKDIGWADEKLISQWIDADLGMRFKKNNWKCIANGDISFVHLKDHKDNYQDVLDHDLFKGAWRKNNE